MKRLLLLLGIISIPPVFACTMFANFDGTDNSLIIAKNRDNRPDRQVIQVVATPGKYKYLALSREDVPNFVSAGVNDHNLAVFNEVTVEYSAKAKGGVADDFSRDILENYTHAKDVIPDIAKLVAKFPDPVFYQVADNEQILSIEVAPNHKFAYKLISRGTYSHTNNYLDKSLIKNYPYTGREKARLNDSTARLKRADDLLRAESLSTFNTFQTISYDHNAGNNNSILRFGDSSNPNSVKSLAFFAVKIARDGKAPTQVTANLYNVGEKYHYILDQKFWQQYTTAQTILKPNE